MFLDKLFGKSSSVEAELEQLKKIQVARDESMIHQIESLLQSIADKLEKKPKKSKSTLMEQVSASRLFKSPRETCIFIERTLSMLKDKGIHAFIVIAAPYYGMAKDCSEYLMNKGIAESELAILTPDMDETAEKPILQAVKSGQRRILIADSNRFDWKWHLGDMKEFIAKGSSKTKPQALLFILEPELMTTLQIEQAKAVIDRTDESGSFPSSLFNKDILVLASAEAVIDVDVIRNSRKSDKPWEINDILDNLQNAVTANNNTQLQRMTSLLPLQKDPTVVWQLLDDALKLLDVICK